MGPDGSEISGQTQYFFYLSFPSAITLLVFGWTSRRPPPLFPRVETSVGQGPATSDEWDEAGNITGAGVFAFAGCAAAGRWSRSGPASARQERRRAFCLATQQSKHVPPEIAEMDFARRRRAAVVAGFLAGFGAGATSQIRGNPFVHFGRSVGRLSWMLGVFAGREALRRGKETGRRIPDAGYARAAARAWYPASGIN